MPTPFGEHLKREREMRGVTIQEISTATRISSRFLEALENENWDQLPGGVFNRGFIRSIARFLGLDEETLVAEYALESNAKPELRTTSHSEQIPRDWQPLGAAAAILVLVLGGVFAVYHFGPAWVAHIRAKRHKVAEFKPQADNVDPKNGTQTALGASLAPLSLQIDATKPAAVRVMADGKVVFSGRFRRKETKGFEASQNFEITSTDPSALRFQLNGQPVSLPDARGRPTETVTFTRADLKQVAGVSH
jgi:cytoskeletal protein RodZ